MASQNDFPDALEQLDLGPLQVEVDRRAERPDHADAVVRLQWVPTERRNHPERQRRGPRTGSAGEGRGRWYLAEFAKGRSLRDVRNAAWRLWDRPPTAPSEAQPGRLLVMPYLSRTALGVLREMGVDALDLCGNGVVQGDEWWFYQHGNPNRYSKQRSRAPYRGKSALVGRALLLRPTYDAVGEVQEEIERRGASISLSQVSKVLSALEDDLVIQRKGRGVRLLQPAKLLDALVDAYSVAPPAATLEAGVEIDAHILGRLRARAEGAGARIVGFDPQRYAIAPNARERLEVYVEPRIGSDLGDAFDLEPVTRFSTLVIRAVDEPGVYFDAQAAEGFTWAPPLEVYLQLMQGGKREKEIASTLRADLLA